jgi:hypothetical protein
MKFPDFKATVWFDFATILFLIFSYNEIKVIFDALNAPHRKHLIPVIFLYSPNEICHFEGR